MKLRQRNRIILLMLLTVFIFMGTAPAQAEGPKKVAILPFKVNAAEDLTYLQDGIVDMLSSRLAWKGEVEILEKGLVRQKIAEMGEPKNQDQAVRIGRALKVDYVIMGSLTVFGESVSIDAKIMDVNKGEELITAYNQSKGMDEVIPTINQFALDINEKIMGRVIQPRLKAAQTEEGQGPAGPEDLIDQKPSFARRYSVQINSLDIGDVDGDQRPEMVFVDATTVYVYKWDEQSFKLFKKIKGSWSPYYLYVSLGDMDRNGRAEIYVSNVQGNSLSSFVLEWNGSDFQKIADGEPWYFRVMDIPDQGPRLIGQKRAIGGSLVGKVQFLARENDHFKPTGELDLNDRASVFNFALIDLKGPNPYSVMFGPFDYLWLLDPSHKEIWISDNYYGGTYDNVPSPLYITDIDRDGSPEVMVCSNQSVTRRLTENLRIFSNGEVYFLTYDEVGLSMKYKSRKQSGAVVGYRLADLNNDGRTRLVIASVTAQDYTIQNPRSLVVVYDLKQ